MTSTTRRELLGAAAAGGAGLSLLPRSLHEAMASPMRPGGLRAIEHVVVLMQENRAFDHYFGTMRGVRGYGDRAMVQLRNGRPIYEQPNPAGGSVTPFSVREAAERAGRADSDIQYLGDLDHSWDGSTAAWEKGFYDGWIGAKTPATMTYYERRDIPLQYELAETFTFCDAYHCSLFGPTNPNRNYLVSGTTGFEPGTTERAVTNAAYDYDHPGYEWTSYPERLEAAGVSWQVYQEWDNFTDNAIEYFVPFKRIGTKLLQSVDGGYRTTEEFYYALFDKPPAEQQRMLAQVRGGPRAPDRGRAQPVRPRHVPQRSREPRAAAEGRHRRGDPAAGELARALRGRLRASRRVDAGGQREPDPRRARRARLGSRDLVEDGAAHQLRRERRLLRPRAAARASAATRRRGRRPLQGPNRFWCELAGTRSGAAARVDVRPRALGFRSLLSLELENEGDEPVTLRLNSLGHGRHDVTVSVRPGRRRTVTWDTDQGWYDVEVTAREDRTFRRRMTGRVETRRAGVTP